MKRRPWTYDQLSDQARKLAVAQSVKVYWRFVAIGAMGLWFEDFREQYVTMAQEEETEADYVRTQGKDPDADTAVY